MNTIALIMSLSLLVATGVPAAALIFTFDDLPVGVNPSDSWHVVFMGAFRVADHGSVSWGLPHSGPNVVVWTSDYGGAYIASTYGGCPSTPFRDVGAYFSTQPGVVIEMLGYPSAIYDEPAVSTLIGGDEPWNNAYAGITFHPGILFVELRALTSGGLARFCMDDFTVKYVPEPSSLSIVSLALASVGVWRLRRRR